ncbi:hypothetical protein RRG08_048544 [Elysia crispata]|uniref:Uncharacterized protein n=1 Tax=Elysia crispata TaxID=231223 RepID=A0AAE1B6F8_9GAST|nr:hypothetical protein RRG08_048544 [Elysia crispata]
MTHNRPEKNNPVSEEEERSTRSNRTSTDTMSKGSTDRAIGYKLGVWLEVVQSDEHNPLSSPRWAHV